MKNKFSVLVACLWTLLFLTAPAFGQRVWETKPYQQWSVKDALKILTDSPWAQTDDSYREGFFPDDIRARHAEMNDPYPSGLATSVRLRSALPIRQAFLRQKQISVKYDKKSAADKAKFDAEVKEFLDCPPCAKYYIVTMDSGFLNSLLKTFPEKYPFEKFQSRAFLVNDKEQWRPCVHVKQENQELLFFFTRLDDKGKSLVTSENKLFGFTMTGKLQDGKLLAGSSWDFEVSTITLGGEIVF
jgi:hypothetical protein